MRVNVYNKDDTTKVINVRYTDEIAEYEGMSDQDAEKMEDELKKAGRYWTNNFYLSKAN